MKHKIITHLFDLLQNDARLIQAGDTWIGWSEVRRIISGDAPTQGSVNLYDHAQTETASYPAVFAGLKGNDGQDNPDFDAINSELIEFRQLLLPVVVEVVAPAFYDATRQRDQLVRNIRLILKDRLVESGYWYDLRVLTERSKASASGSGAQSGAQAETVMTVRIGYSRGGGQSA